MLADTTLLFVVVVELDKFTHRSHLRAEQKQSQAKPMPPSSIPRMLRRSRLWKRVRKSQLARKQRKSRQSRPSRKSRQSPVESSSESHSVNSETHYSSIEEFLNDAIGKMRLIEGELATLEAANVTNTNENPTVINNRNERIKVLRQKREDLLKCQKHVVKGVNRKNRLCVIS